MRNTSLIDIKKELQVLPVSDLVDLCVNLAKYKKDNKELLGYLLFESGDKEQFIKDVKFEIELQINELNNQKSLFIIKKGLRKSLRMILKYSKYVNDKGLSAELYLYFCIQVKQSKIPFHESPMLINIYNRQLNKVRTLIQSLHEDLQFDYIKELESLILE